VKDVADFPTLGGRVEYLEGHAAAVLTYGRRAHVINLFVWPLTAPAPATSQTRNGYHMRSWSAGGMTFWAVSDLNESELAQFVSLHPRIDVAQEPACGAEQREVRKIELLGHR
jgi:anti-sigma factor RsiW